MTVEERLLALRLETTPADAFRRRKLCKPTDAAFWQLNALCFDWHLNPTPFAISSFKYAERLRA